MIGFCNKYNIIISDEIDCYFCEYKDDIKTIENCSYLVEDNNLKKENG